MHHGTSKMLDFLGLAPHGAETSKIPAQELPNVLLEQTNVVANGTPVKEIIWEPPKPGVAHPFAFSAKGRGPRTQNGGGGTSGEGTDRAHP